MSTDDGAVKMRMAVADLVRRERERAGLSVVEAAKVAGIGRSTWTEIEAGTPPMKKAATLGKVARAIHLDTDALLAAAGYRTQQDPGEPTDDEIMRLLGVVIDELRALRHDNARLHASIAKLAAPPRDQQQPARVQSRPEQTGAPR